MGLENEDGTDCMVMKLSKDSDKLAEEVCILLNIQKRMKKERLKTIANVRMYGMLVLSDFDPYQKESQLMAYYTMPVNQMSLLNYVLE